MDFQYLEIRDKTSKTDVKSLLKTVTLQFEDTGVFKYPIHKKDDDLLKKSWEAAFMCLKTPPQDSLGFKTLY